MFITLCEYTIECQIFITSLLQRLPRSDNQLPEMTWQTHSYRVLGLLLASS